MTHRTRCRLLDFQAISLAAGLMLAGAAAAQTTTFSQGSLIIPMQANFQTPCGTFSAYGLVWRILKENQPGGYFTQTGRHPVTVYEIINQAKASHNRCIPTNLNTAPSDAGAWNDGCDFSISGSGGIPPVVPVPAGAPLLPSTGLYAVATIPFLSTQLALAKPNYQAPTGYSTPSQLTQINYMGAPFVIASSDVSEVMTWLNSNLADPTLSRFTTYDPTEESQCNDYNTITSYGPASPNSSLTYDYHYVHMHQSTGSFTAPVARRLNAPPPKIALLLDLDPLGSQGIVQSFLDDYLRQAGLYFVGTPNNQDSAGCPIDTHSGCTLNGSTGATAYPGLIYDAFYANADFVSMTNNGRSYPQGLLNGKAADGGLNYPVFWAPHWQIGASSLPIDGGYYTGAEAFQADNVIANLKTYAGTTNTGLLAQCASIDSYENPQDSIDTTAAYFLSDGGIIRGSSGFTWWPQSSPIDGQNCTDPDVPASARDGGCAFFSNVGNAFAQIGDFRFYSMNGQTPQFKPISTMQPAPADYPLIQFQNRGRKWEAVDFGYYQGNSTLASFVYLGGHDYSGGWSLVGAGGAGWQDPQKILNAGGIRIALNTLMNLGYQKVSGERGIAAPTGFIDPDGGQPYVLAGTYNAVLSAPPNAQRYQDLNNDGSGSRNWLFPYNTGHLRAHALSGSSALAANTESNFNAATLWDADSKLPLPGQRNLFTYIGGQFVTDTTTNIANSSGAKMAQNWLIRPAAAPILDTSATRYRDPARSGGVLQGGWVPETIDGTVLQAACSSAGSCVNVLSFGAGSGGRDFNLVPGSDATCDLQQLTNFTPLTASDYATTCSSPNNGYQLQIDITSVQEMLQRVRGYCYAHDARGNAILQPTDSQCDTQSLQTDNRAHLGGVVHSTAALVGPSQFVVSNVPRPIVAYVGTLDGQLHAIYVGGGSGYTGPSSPIHVPNQPANVKFINDYSSTPFSPPAAGTELWSFMPASQLQRLWNNTAAVDSSPAVIDVYGDFGGTGAREWHTVLVASTGLADGSEVFALDVTNPLQPAVLWDIMGVFHPQGAGSGTKAFSPIPIANGNLDGSDAGTVGWSWKWDQETTDFRFFSTVGGFTQQVPYNYNDLGGTTAIAVGQLRVGLQPVYAAFVSTNSGQSSGSGLEVHALDLVTGQKLWQWEERYGVPSWTSSSGTPLYSNDVPPGPTLLQSSNGSDRLYAGDMQGRLWELSPTTGQNWNLLLDATSAPWSTPAFDADSIVTARQPITTNIAVALVPGGATGVFASHVGERIAIFGTAGVNWSGADAWPGRVHFTSLESTARASPFSATNSNLTRHGTSGTDYTGALQEIASMPISFTAPERVYGNILVSGQTVFFQTALDVIPSDINTLPPDVAGRAYTLNLGSATPGTPTPLIGALARFGGSTVVHDSNTNTDVIVSNEVGKIASQTSTSPATNPNPQLKLQASNVYSTLRTWLGRFF